MVLTFEERKANYEKRYQELIMRCRNCNTCNPERCESCTTGKRLRWLESEFSDVTRCGHSNWNKV